MNANTNTSNNGTNNTVDELNSHTQVYVKKDFSLNPKCLILSTLLSGLYAYISYNPVKSYYGINPLIFVLIYL